MANDFRLFSCYESIIFSPPVLAVAFGLLHDPSHAQFIKEIDDNGNVSYRQDPAYDYSADEPSEENRRINEEQLRRLREFIDYRANRPAPKRRPPQMTIRTGPAVCKKRISLLKLKTHGCD